MTSADTKQAQGRGRSGSPRRSGSSTAGVAGLASGGAGRLLVGSAPSLKGPGGGKISIELSKRQVDQVVRDAGRGGTMSVLLSALRSPDWALALDAGEYPAQMDDRRLSRSLLSGLLVLSCFAADGADLGIADLARMLGTNTSTTHRYVTTLRAVGLLEQDASTRRYRLASA